MAVSDHSVTTLLCECHTEYSSSFFLGDVALFSLSFSVNTPSIEKMYHRAQTSPKHHNWNINILFRFYLLIKKWRFLKTSEQPTLLEKKRPFCNQLPQTELKITSNKNGQLISNSLFPSFPLLPYLTGVFFPFSLFLPIVSSSAGRNPVNSKMKNLPSLSE